MIKYHPIYFLYVRTQELCDKVIKIWNDRSGILHMRKGHNTYYNVHIIRIYIVSLFFFLHFYYILRLMGRSLSYSPSTKEYASPPVVIYRVLKAIEELKEN